MDLWEIDCSYINQTELIHIKAQWQTSVVHL